MGVGLGGGCIRLYHPGEFVGSAMELCPITAVAYDRIGAYHDPLNWRDAADEIGLDHETGKVIAEAADHEAPWPIQPERARQDQGRVRTGDVMPDFAPPGTSLLFSDSGLNHVPFEINGDMDAEDLCEHLQGVTEARTKFRVSFNIKEND